VINAYEALMRPVKPDRRFVGGPRPRRPASDAKDRVLPGPCGVATSAPASSDL